MRRLAEYLLRRTAAGLLTIVAMITLTFVIFWAIPTTPARFVYPFSPHLTPYQIRTANHLLGTDRPKLVQYGDYLSHLLRGDFGHEWTGAQLEPVQKLVQQPIGPQLFPALGVTLSLILGGAALVLCLALPLGALAGRRIGSLSDRTISLVALAGICTHPMVIGLILKSIFTNRLHWTPYGGYCPLFPGKGALCGGPADWASHLALPWIAFALLFLALYTRMIRSSVAETMHEDFVRTAYAKGARDRRVLGRHVLPNAGLRVLTMVGMDVGTAIGVAVYVEAAYGFQGLGRLSVYAMIGGSALDLPLLLAVVTMLTVVVVVGNLVVDFLYAVIDPRTGLSSRSTRSKALAGGVI